MLRKLMALVLYTAVMTSGVSLAGVSGEDPIVAAIRIKYAQAQAPTLSDLQVGEIWVCQWYSARPGSYGKGDPSNTFSFSEVIEGVVISKLPRSSETITFHLGVSGLEIKEMDYLDLPNRVRRTIYTSVGRKVESSLIFESSIYKSELPDIKYTNNTRYEDSAVDNTRVVTSYLVCKAR